MGVANLQSCHQEIWQHGLIMVGGAVPLRYTLGIMQPARFARPHERHLSVVSLPDEVFHVVDQRFGKTSTCPATCPVRGET